MTVDGKVIGRETLSARRTGTTPRDLVRPHLALGSGGELRDGVAAEPAHLVLPLAAVPRHHLLPHRAVEMLVNHRPRKRQRPLDFQEVCAVEDVRVRPVLCNTNSRQRVSHDRCAGRPCVWCVCGGGLSCLRSLTSASPVFRTSSMNWINCSHTKKV